jgi:phage antirepressor YoqD-like protein
MKQVIKAKAQNVVTEREFNGMNFKFREDGYFNMTHAAKNFGKQMTNFWNHSETPKYMAALEVGISSTLGANNLNLVEVIHGNRYIADRGTWAHPKLAVFFARWLDVKFAVFCDMTIDDLMHGHSVLHVVAPEKAIAPKLPQTYLESLQELIESVKEQERLQAMVQKQEAILIEQAPKVDFMQRYVDIDGDALGIQAAARLMKLNMRELGHWLVDEKYCFRDATNTLLPYSRYIDQGLFDIKTGIKTHGEGTFQQMKITNKGREYINARVARYVRK